MNLANALFCLGGMHRRDARLVRFDGERLRSRCLGCDAAMAKDNARWRLSDSPPDD